MTDPEPTPPASRTPPGRSFVSVGAIGTAALACAALVVAGEIASAVTAPAALRAYDAAAAAGRDPATVSTAHDVASSLRPLLVIAWIVTSIWLSRVRRNAELIAPQRLRRSAPWCWLGWIVPIVSLWFPKQIVDDSWQITAGALAEDPVSLAAISRRTMPWWLLLVLYAVLSRAADVHAQRAAHEVQRGVVPLLEAGTALAAVAALVLWAGVVRGVSSAAEELVDRRG